MRMLTEARGLVEQASIQLFGVQDMHDLSSDVAGSVCERIEQSADRIDRRFSRLRTRDMERGLP